MLIGLIDIEPKIVNTAYMQIAFYHRHKGDTVEWAAPLEYDKYDKLYCSSLFDYTDKTNVPKRAICGGTGFDLTTVLPRAIERCGLDYSIYPGCQRSFLWFSRGCPRRCPWCVVPKKEGGIKTALPKNLNPAGKYIVVCDNNLFANPHWQNAIEELRLWGRPVDLQGVDVRTLSADKCRALLTLKHHKQIKVAWDSPYHELTRPLEFMTTFIKPYKIMCYVLIGYYDTPDLDLYRVERLRDLGIDPFVMPFDKADDYQKRFARWCNHKAIFKSVKWKDYR